MRDDGRLDALVADARRRRLDLAAELSELAATTAEGPDDEHDPEGSTIGYERARIASLLAGVDVELDRLAAAFSRVAAGVYCTCVRCQQPIGAERLEALPTTDRCVACAALT